MPIIVNLDVMLAKRKVRLNDLSKAVGVTAQNLSILKTGKAGPSASLLLILFASTWTVSLETSWNIKKKMMKKMMMMAHS